jgi:hypothetical protein
VLTLIFFILMTFIFMLAFKMPSKATDETKAPLAREQVP